jgi:hypothetical protein
MSTILMLVPFAVGVQVSLTIKDAQEGSFINDFLLSNDPSDENVFKLKAYLNERAPRMLAILDDDDYRKFFTRSTFTGAVTKCNRYNVDEFLVLLGDAAHSVIPPTGEGACMGRRGRGKGRGVSRRVKCVSPTAHGHDPYSHVWSERTQGGV